MNRVLELDGSLDDVLDAEVNAILTAGGGDVEAEVDALLKQAAPSNGTEKRAAQADVDMWQRTLFFVSLQEAATAALGAQRQGQSAEDVRKTISAYKELYGVTPAVLVAEQRSALVNQASRELTDQYAALTRQAKVQKHNGNLNGLVQTEETQARVRDALRAVIQASRDWAE